MLLLKVVSVLDSQGYMNLLDRRRMLRVVKAVL